MMNGKYIYEYGEISLHLSETAKNDKISNFADRVAFRYNNPDLGVFIRYNTESFFDNRVTKTYGNIDVPIGMKLLKAFKYYENNVETLHKIQDEASMIIQEDKITGTLCFSVHPFDYMSLSENTYNWRSCHALDGEYAAGNLSYMGDHSTLICYIKGKEDARLPNFNFDWNNKKWRMLLYFSENRDMIFAGRQYPFFSEDIFDYLNDALRKMHFNINAFTGWDDYCINDMALDDKYLNARRTLIPYHQIIKDVSRLHYNDLLYSSCYTPWYCYDWSVVGVKDIFGDEKVYYPEFKIGYDVKCLECGETYIEYGEGTFKCDYCYDKDSDDYYTCDCCGRRVPFEDTVYVNNGEYCICRECLNNETFTCGCCEQPWFNTDAYYYESDNKYYCPHCYNEIKERDKKGGYSYG